MRRRRLVLRFATGRRLREALLCLAVLACGVSSGRASSPGFLVTVGDVGPRSALFWLRVADATPASLEVGAVGIPPERRLEAAPAPEADFTARVRVDGLHPGTRYAYRVRWQAEVDRTLNPTRLYADGGFDNFGEIRLDASGLTERIIDADGRERFGTTLLPERRPEGPDHRRTSVGTAPRTLEGSSRLR